MFFFSKIDQNPFQNVSISSLSAHIMIIIYSFYLYLICLLAKLTKQDYQWARQKICKKSESFRHFQKFVQEKDFPFSIKKNHRNIHSKSYIFPHNCKDFLPKSTISGIMKFHFHKFHFACMS